METIATIVKKIFCCFVRDDEREFSHGASMEAPYIFNEPVSAPVRRSHPGIPVAYSDSVYSRGSQQGSVRGSFQDSFQYGYLPRSSYRESPHNTIRAANQGSISGGSISFLFRKPQYSTGSVSSIGTNRHPRNKNLDDVFQYWQDDEEDYKCFV
jgi:hypothetical protein